MKVEILKEFRDKNNFSKTYSVGKTYDFEDNRAKELIQRGLVGEVKSRKRVERDFNSE